MHVMDRQMVHNKMSLTNFKDWTTQLKERMHAELNVLCEKNVALQVDNRVLMQRIEPVKALEKSTFAEQEGEDVKGMLVSECDVMKKSMMDIGHQIWKEIKERLESWVTKLFFTLQGAFITQHESNLLQQLQWLE